MPASPKDLGCKCHECPLRGRKPVMPRTHKSPKLIILNEFPTSWEEEQQKHLSGLPGRIMREVLHPLKVALAQCHIDYVTLCRPPANISASEHKKAAMCCAPHLEAVDEYPKTTPCLALGKKAFEASTHRTTFKKWLLARAPGQGSFADRVVLVFHSLYTVISKPSYLPILRVAAERCFTPAPAHTFKHLWYRGDNKSLVRALQQLRNTRLPLAVDIETAGTDPLTAPILCIGVGNKHRAVSVPWDVNADGFLEVAPEARKLLRELLASPVDKIAHNASHDFMGLKAAGFEIGGTIHDTMLAHWVCGPELQHDLQFVTLCELDLPPWKAAFAEGMDPDLKGSSAWLKRDQYELREYNAKDVQATARVWGELQERLEQVHRGPEQYASRRRLRDIAQHMSEVGMPVLLSAKDELNERLTGEITKAREVLQAQMPRIELGATGGTRAVEHFFFDILKAPKLSYTEKGKPQLNDACLQYMKAYGTKRQKTAATALERLRELTKIQGTYVADLPLSVAPGATHGFVHPSWKVTGTVTGRWASADPNMQNVPPAVRKMFIAPCGWKWVSSDYAQLEGRLMAALSGDKVMCEGFAAGEDLYKMVAAGINNCTTAEVTKQQRQIAKEFWLALSYGAGVDRLYRTSQQRGLAIQAHQVATMLTNLKRRMTGLMAWQDELLEYAREHHYVEEPITGWREYYHDGRVSPTKAKNFPCQATAAAIVNNAVERVASMVDWKSIKLVAQIHDEILLLAQDDVIDQAVEILCQAMTRTVTFRGTVELKVDPLVGQTWADVKD